MSVYTRLASALSHAAATSPGVGVPAAADRAFARLVCTDPVEAGKGKGQVSFRVLRLFLSLPFLTSCLEPIGNKGQLSSNKTYGGRGGLPWFPSLSFSGDMRQPCNAEQHKYLKDLRAINLARVVPAEEWAWKAICKTKGQWTRQAVWGCRIFDFFSIKRGIAVEIDGATHNATYDAIRDKYNYIRSGILVLRVRNWNEADLAIAIAEINRGETRKERKKRVRIELGLSDHAPMKDAVKAAGLQLAHGRWSPPA